MPLPPLRNDSLIDSGVLSIPPNARMGNPVFELKFLKPSQPSS